VEKGTGAPAGATRKIKWESLRPPEARGSPKPIPHPHRTRNNMKTKTTHIVTITKINNSITNNNIHTHGQPNHGISSQQLNVLTRRKHK
jgi:hypothetical protein